MQGSDVAGLVSPAAGNGAQVWLEVGESEQDCLVVSAAAPGTGPWTWEELPAALRV